MIRTQRDNEIIYAVTMCTIGVDVKLAAETWWKNSRDPERDARKRLDKLCSGKQLVKRRGWSLSIPPVVKPVWSKPAGQRINLKKKDTYRISHQLRSRWEDSEIGAVTLYAGSRYAASRLGAPNSSRLRDLTDWPHDIHMAHVYHHFLANRPDEAANWIHEDCYAAQRRGEKLPDAIITDPDTGRWRKIIEGGGSYHEQRVQAFLSYWAEHGTDLEIELW